VQRGFIGVSIQDLNAQTAREYGLDSKQLQGAYVAALSPNGAAQAAGIREGDLITEIGGKSVRSASELQEQVANYKPGDAVEVTILRAGKTQKLKVILRNINGGTELLKSETDTKNMTMSKQTENRENIESVLGARLQAIDMLAMKQLDIEYGVKVQQLESGGVLARAGVPAGYVIVKINHQPVRDLDNVKQILKRAGRTIYLEGVYPSGRKRSFMVLLD
jgi:S1-C subfamily serine protease